MDILASFLKSVLDIPDEEYEQLTLVDPYLKKESEDDKYGILDVRVHTISGQIINVEIQVLPVPDMEARAVFYQSKMITEQISSGQDYSAIKRVVTIIITDYVLVPGSGRYHNQFRSRTLDGIEFTALTEYDTLELCKLTPETDDTDLWYWMKFIKSDEEDMNMIAQRSPQHKKAVGVLMELSADERTRMIAENREKARRDIASMIRGAEQKAEQEKAIAIARKMLAKKMPVADIADVTGLTREEVEALSAQEQIAK